MRYWKGEADPQNVDYHWGWQFGVVLQKMARTLILRTWQNGLKCTKSLRGYYGIHFVLHTPSYYYAHTSVDLLWVCFWKFDIPYLFITSMRVYVFIITCKIYYGHFYLTPICNATSKNNRFKILSSSEQLKSWLPQVFLVSHQIKLCSFLKLCIPWIVLIMSLSAWIFVFSLF